MYILILLVWIFTAIVTGVVASDKGHGFGSWTLAGLLLGPFGLIAAAGLSDQKLREFIRRTIDPDSIHQIQNTQKLLNRTNQYLDSKPRLLQESKSNFDSQRGKYIGDFLLKKTASEDQIWEKILQILEFSRPDIFLLADRGKSNINLSLKGGKAYMICKSDGEKVALAYAKESSEDDFFYWQIKIH
tara:strand:- start:3499 stop:4059 length:561 start_codon:yes stop_codon:yes gene_type:complete